jgi:hypothetical protein
MLQESAQSRTRTSDENRVSDAGDGPDHTPTYTWLSKEIVVEAGDMCTSLTIRLRACPNRFLGPFPVLDGTSECLEPRGAGGKPLHAYF